MEERMGGKHVEPRFLIRIFLCSECWWIVFGLDEFLNVYVLFLTLLWFWGFRTSRFPHVRDNSPRPHGSLFAPVLQLTEFMLMFLQDSKSIYTNFVASSLRNFGGKSPSKLLPTFLGCVCVPVTATVCQVSDSLTIQNRIELDYRNTITNTHGANTSFLVGIRWMITRTIARKYWSCIAWTSS